MPVLNLLQKNLLLKSKGLTEICDKNSYTLQFLLTMAELKRNNSAKEVKDMHSSDSEPGSDNDHSEDDEDMELESKWDDNTE